MMIHTGELPFACEICDYRGRQRTALNWHMKSKHPDIPYEIGKKMGGKKTSKKDRGYVPRNTSRSNARGARTSESSDVSHPVSERSTTTGSEPLNLTAAAVSRPSAFIYPHLNETDPMHFQ